MSVSTVFTLGPANAGADAGTAIPALEDHTLDHGVSTLLTADSGQAWADHGAVASAAPMVRFSTLDIGAALDALGVGGYALVTGAGQNQMAFYYLSKANKGVRSSGSVHRRIRVVDGLVVPERLSVGVGGWARMTYACHARYDGTNDPVQFDASQAAPTASAVDDVYGLGKFVLNGTDLGGVQSVEVDFGIEVDKKRSEADVYPTFVGINRMRPRVTVQTFEPVNLATLGITGTGSASTNSLLYLQHVTKYGQRTADATTSHLSLTFGGWLASPGTNPASQDGDMVTEFVLEPLKKTGVDLIASATGVAIV